MSYGLLGAYQALAHLAGAQLEALENADLDAFWRLTAEREAAFAELQRLEPEAPRLAPDEKQAIAALVPAILKTDRYIEVHLDRLQAETQAELAKLHSGMTALNSYAVGREREAFFIDRPS